MEALFIVLNDTDHLEDIMEKFLELGVKGATVVDSDGMAGYIVRSHPGMNSLISGHFSKLGKSYNPNSKTIFTVVKDHEMADRVANAIKEILINTEKKIIGFMFTVPVSRIYTLSDH